jgi:hypothetical protein
MVAKMRGKLQTSRHAKARDPRQNRRDLIMRPAYRGDQLFLSSLHAIAISVYRTDLLGSWLSA